MLLYRMCPGADNMPGHPCPGHMCFLEEWRQFAKRAWAD